MSTEEKTEIANLRLRVMQLERKQMQHCRGCLNLHEEFTGTFHVCPLLGSVDPDRDGCSRKRTRC